MNCKNMREIWDEYRDGGLSTPQRDAFESHLKSCAKCAALWQKESALLDELKQPVALSPLIAQAVLHEWKSSSQTARKNPFHLFRFGAWGVLAAALLVAFALGVHAKRKAHRAKMMSDPLAMVVHEMSGKNPLQPLQLLGGISWQSLATRSWETSVDPRHLNFPDPAQFMEPSANTRPTTNRAPQS